MAKYDEGVGVWEEGGGPALQHEPCCLPEKPNSDIYTSEDTCESLIILR